MNPDSIEKIIANVGTPVFVYKKDILDENLRRIVDKSNKNPMKLLAKLTAEFPESITILKDNERKQKLGN